MLEKSGAASGGTHSRPPWWPKAASALGVYALVILAIGAAIGPGRDPSGAHPDILGHAAAVWDLANNIPWHDWLGGGWSWAFGGGLSSVDFHSQWILATGAILSKLGIEPFSAAIYVGLAASVMIPVCMWYLGRCVGGEWPVRAALWAGGVLVTLGFIVSTYGGSVMYVLSGALAQTASMAFAYLAVALLYKSLFDNRSPWPAGLALGMAVSSHYLGGVLAIVMSVTIFSIALCKSGNPLKIVSKGAVIATIGVVLSSHWWVPKIFFRYAAASPQWGNHNSVWAFFRTDYNVWIGDFPGLGWHSLQSAAIAGGAVGILFMAYVDIRSKFDRERLGGIGLSVFVAAATFALWALVSKLPGQDWVREVRYVGMWYTLCLIGLSYLIVRGAVWVAGRQLRVGRITMVCLALTLFVVPITDKVLAQRQTVEHKQRTLAQHPSPKSTDQSIYDRLGELDSCNGPASAYGVQQISAVVSDGCVVPSKHTVIESSTTYLHELSADNMLHTGTHGLDGEGAFEKNHTVKILWNWARISSTGNIDVGMSMYRDLGVSKMFRSTYSDEVEDGEFGDLEWSDESTGAVEYSMDPGPDVHGLLYDPVRSDFGSVDDWVRPSIRLWADEHRRAADGGLGPASVVRLAMGGAEHWLGSAGEARAVRHRAVRVSDIDIGGREISFSVDRVGVPVLVRATWHPRWTTDDASGPWLVSPGWMAVIPHEQHVMLRYTDDWISHVPYVSLGLLFVAALAHGAVCVRGRRTGAGLATNSIGAGDGAAEQA